MLAFRRKITECSKKGSLERELTISQIETLMLIGPDGSRTMESIAAHFGVTPPSATSLVAKLERKGLVVRRKDKKDRRVICIELSASAKKTIVNMWKKKEEALERITSKLSKKDKSEFIRILQVLVTD